MSGIRLNNPVFVAVDKGALYKTYELNNAFSPNNSVIKFDKIRNQTTGKIESIDFSSSTTDIEYEQLSRASEIVICDDICDGGGTFIPVLEKLRQQTANSTKFILYMTHGLFTKGVDIFFDAMKGVNLTIITTNTVEIYNHPSVEARIKSEELIIADIKEVLTNLNYYHKE
jgi:ribose-phosphate pyrophosphokinase